MTACRACAVQCDRCPLCRANIESTSKIFLPPLLQSRKGTIASRRPSETAAAGVVGGAGGGGTELAGAVASKAPAAAPLVQ
uniref:RING-type domain-containing protein n=2 Tax=gambiae species complex TaxID=44542 RepID=A0A6E8W735_ANOCL